MKKILLLLALLAASVPAFAAQTHPGGTSGQIQYNNNGAFAGWGGPNSPAPTVTPTANTNLYYYTGELTTGWSLAQQAVATGGQTDENGNATASVFAANTTSNVAHDIIWYSPTIAYTSATPVTFTIYAKPNGYNFVDFGFYFYTNGTGTYNDNWFNINTCTVVSSATGFTNTATAAGNGYCLLTAQYTTGSPVNLKKTYIGSAPTSATLTYAGDGASGAYFSHPQFTATSTAQTYQDITGNHHYCVAAYNIFGQTGGCSPWINSTAETNSITIPTVSGASYYKLFRTGGYTTGALIVSGSTQLAAGQVVTDYQLTTDGNPAPAQNAVVVSPSGIADTRTSVTTTYKNVGMVANSTMRILQAEPGLPGTITYIHISSNAPTGVDNILLNFTCAGQTTQTVDLGTFFMLEEFPSQPFSNNRIGLTVSQPNGQYSAQREVEIPFTSGCSIDLINNEANNYGVYADITYKAGLFYSSPLRHVWHAVLNTLTTTPAAFNATLNLLPTVTNSSGLELESITQFITPVSATGCYGYLEGIPNVYTDGNVAVTANGTEDFYLGGFYFDVGNASTWNPATAYTVGSLAKYNGTNWVAILAGTNQTPQIGSAYWAIQPAVNLQNDRVGDFIGPGLLVKTANNDALFYRFFGTPETQDNVLAANTLQVTWQNGYPGANTSCQPTVNWKSLVTYWTGS